MIRHAHHRPQFSLRALCLAVFAMSATVFSQDAATLKARFATLFKTSTTGSYAKMVWMKIATNMSKPDVDLATIFAMDTKDGSIRTLVAQTSSAYAAPSITWDGKRVIYLNHSDLTVHRINWDGAGDTVILRNFEGGGRCWQSADNKQWTLMTEYKGDGVNGAGLYRVNIDNPTERVLLLTCSSWSRVSWIGSTTWASMSVDGKYVAGGFPNYGGLGSFAVKTPAATSVRYLSPNGCWPTVSRDNKYQILFTDDGSLAHKELYIGDTTGKKITAKSLVGTPILPGGSTDGFESLRWSSDPDYCALWSGWYQGGQCNGAGTTNPKIVRISDLAWAGIHDNCTTAEGNCDVWFYTESVAVRNPVNIAAVNASGSAANFVRTYDCRGRDVTSGRAARSGVFIGFSGGKAKCLLAGSAEDRNRLPR